jgi:hypothetical protein
VDVEELKTQNDELDNINKELTLIHAFFIQTGIDIDSTLEQLTGYLSNEINDNMVLVLLSLEHSYQNVFKYWTARGSFDSRFGEKSWIQDKDSPIGSNDYEKFMEFVDEHVVSELCADRTDFENFLATDPVVGYDGFAPPVNLSFHSIRGGVERYFAALMDHYFSFTGNGVSKIQWMEANFDCVNLPTDVRFIWS